MNSLLMPDNLFSLQGSPTLRPDVQRENDLLKLLMDMTNTLVSNLECRDLLRTISASIRQVMGCDAVHSLVFERTPSIPRRGR